MFKEAFRINNLYFLMIINLYRVTDRIPSFIKLWTSFKSDTNSFLLKNYLVNKFIKDPSK